jgi:hypothetical protein
VVGGRVPKLAFWQPSVGHDGGDVVAARVVSIVTLGSLTSRDSLRVSIERTLVKVGNGVVLMMLLVVLEKWGFNPWRRLRMSWA